MDTKERGGDYKEGDINFKSDSLINEKNNIETQMAELAKTTTTIDGMPILIELYKNTSENSNPQRIIEAQIKEIAETINDSGELENLILSAGPIGLREIFEARRDELQPGWRNDN